MTSSAVPLRHLDAERQALVHLHHANGGDSRRLWRLLERHCSARSAVAHAQIPLPGIEVPAKGPGPTQRLQACGARAVAWYDHDYPNALSRQEKSPPILYVRGEVNPSDQCAVAIVGSRRATAWARRLAFELARDLAALGITIVSGLAQGVDAAAHEGALESGRTLAVIGTGIDRDYPAAHRGLARRIAGSGAVLTQFPCGARPEPYHFPIRNDTIARLVLGVVVVEAPEQSGAIITAKCAADYGVDVMVCPGDAGRPSCRGSNRLLADGGVAAVESAQDVLECLRRSWLPVAVPEVAATGVQPAAGGEAKTLDEWAALSGLPAGVLRARLTRFELEGRVVRLEGDRFHLVGPADGWLALLQSEAASDVP